MFCNTFNPGKNNIYNGRFRSNDDCNKEWEGFDFNPILYYLDFGIKKVNFFSIGEVSGGMPKP